MNSFYDGKSVLITGATGFVGKLVVEKLLRVIPNVGQLHLLVRPKAGVDAYQRLQDEVWSSPCFDVLRHQIGSPEAFDAFVRSKVTPVPGDLCQDRFGLDDISYESLASKTQVIIHLAATIDFSERLDIATNLNVLGTLRVVALARRAWALGVLHSVVHVSTCYVNSNLTPGTRVREQLYPLPFDPQEMCMRVLDMSLTEVETIGPKLLRQYGFPNTYTFTKTMAEQLAAQLAGDLPFAIFRPAIIGASLREPLPGWCDSASACGAVFLAVGLGVLQELIGDAAAVSDLIPVDYVVNMLLVTAAYTARVPPALAQPSALPTSSTHGDIHKLKLPGMVSDVPVYHCGTSASPNAVVWGRIGDALVDYWAQRPISNVPVQISMMSQWRFELAFLLKRRLPAAVLSKFASLPGVSPTIQHRAEQATKAVTKLRKMADTFQSFVTSTWYFETGNSARLLASLCPEDVITFTWDPRDIGWRAWVHNYCYGLVSYVLKQPAGSPAPPVPIEHLAAARFQRAML